MEYTKPKLRERLKEQIKQGRKGGRAGQWSARKAQLLAQEYEKHGGGYRGEKTEAQQHLDKWQEEDWQTKEGETRARQDGGTKRYLPKEAWDALSDQEKEEADRQKQKQSRKGRQYVPNPPAARRAGKKARGTRLEDRSKAELYERAQRLDIAGRSKMDKQELIAAIRSALTQRAESSHRSGTC